MEVEEGVEAYVSEEKKNNKANKHSFLLRKISTNHSGMKIY